MSERTEVERHWSPVSGGRHISGVGASPGLAIGRLHQHRAAETIVVERHGAKPPVERKLLAAAIASARGALEELAASMIDRSGHGEAAIFRAHQALLEDSDLTDEVEALVDAGHSAAWAWQRTIDARVAVLLEQSNEQLAARAADLSDVGQRVLRLLANVSESEPELPEEPVILIAADLAPSEAARLDPTRILGACTVGGGPTSHASIIARALGIPAVVGIGAAVQEEPAGIICILDGTLGRLYLEPSDADIESARRFLRELAREQELELQERFVPAMLADGVHVPVVANIGSIAEAARAVALGAEGVGLMRSEMLFLDRDAPPDEEEQFEAFVAMTRALAGLPMVIRTLDIGGDKTLPWLPSPREANPALGVRGVRLCLRRPDLFLPHLRAIYRASAFGPIRMMMPMIATLEELRAVRRIAERVRREVGAEPIEIGIMIEVPAAAVMARELAAEADFFSIGTNDLTQYVMAIDRMHPELGAELDALHPAVLRLIEMTVRGAAEHSRPVAVCGALAADPLGALILGGLGIAELSMSIASIPAIKAALRRHTSADARDLACRALACSSAADVRRLTI